MDEGEAALRLGGKTALITGSGRGIGREIALLFAQEGADIVLAARTETELASVADAVRGFGGRALTVGTDVADQKAIENCVRKSLETFGKIDILVNNAGLSKSKPLLETTLEDWNETLAVDLTALFLFIKLILPGMIDRQEGRIINISSGAGLRGLPGNNAYSAAKAAVIGMSQSLAGEVRDTGVKVNVICPGPIETEMLKVSRNREFLLRDKANLLQPDDVAGAALFLGSDLSGGMNGQILTIRNSNRW